MFSTIRLFIGVLFFCVSIIVTRKSKKNYKPKIIVAAVINALLVVFLNFVPLENVVTTFSSPESVYRYVVSGNYDIKLTLDGCESTMVVGQKGNKSNCLIIPQVSEGWKLGIGVDTKIIKTKNSGAISVSVFQHRKTGEHYISVLDASGAKLDISDNCSSKFALLEKKSEIADKVYSTYYAYLSEFGQGYSIIVNGEQIHIN